MKFAMAIIGLFACVAVGAATPSPQTRTADVTALLAGRYDNTAQVGATSPTPSADPVPRVTIDIETTAQPDFTLWRVHVQTDPDTTYEQTWAMQVRAESDASDALIPYYQFKQPAPPDARTFDAKDWLSLEACAMRGKYTRAHIAGLSEGEPCVAVSMSVGARRALLPLGIVREGDMLHVDFNFRGVRTRIDARKTANPG